MSGADDLRTAIERVASEWVPSSRIAQRHDIKRVADHVIADVLGDPVRRLAILNLIGDVREGTLIDYKSVPYDPVPGWVVEPPGDIHEREGHHAGVPVLVVRPRRETS